MTTTVKSKMLSATELLKQKLTEIKIIGEREKPANYITQEFQDYGMRLAHRLGDIKNKAIYIRLSKIIPRAIIEDAASFVSDYPKAKDKGKIFMWKYRQLLGGYKAKHPEFKLPSTRKPKKEPKTAAKKLNKKGGLQPTQTKARQNMQDNYKLL